jgi:hypothetical protein
MPTPSPSPTPSPAPAPSTLCAGFTDVPATDPNCSAITYVKSIGAETGNTDGTFAPNGLFGLITGYQGGADAGYYRPARNVDRAEFLALLLRNLAGTLKVFLPNYSDVATNQWYAAYAKYAYDNGLFPAPSLNPTNSTSRVEVAKVIYRLHTLGKI